jgi:hypothetical protein
MGQTLVDGRTQRRRYVSSSSAIAEDRRAQKLAKALARELRENGEPNGAAKT